MKKIHSIISCLLTIFALFSLTGCTAEPQNMPCCSNDSRIICNTYAEYEEFTTKAAPLPHYFLTYDKLSMIGKFSRFYNYGFSYTATYEVFAPYRSYVYDFKDASGNTVHMLFQYCGTYLPVSSALPSTSEKKIPFSYLEETGIRHLKNAQTDGYDRGYMEINDIRYFYRQDELFSIQWSYRGLVFMLENLNEYPNWATDTFVGKLLQNHKQTEETLLQFSRATMERENV